jgi:hypothetical protein
MYHLERYARWAGSAGTLNSEHSVANTGGNPKNGRRVCRAVQPVMVDERIIEVEGPGPVSFNGPCSNTPFWPGVHLRREVGCGPK